MSRRRRLAFGLTIQTTRRDVNQLAKDAADVARSFVEVQAELASERGHSITTDFVDERVKEIEAKVLQYFSLHLEDDLEEFLRRVLVLFAFGERRSAILSVLTEEGADPAAIRETERFFIDGEKLLDELLIADRRKLPRGAPPGKRPSTRAKSEEVRAMYLFLKKIHMQKGESVGKAKLLPILAKCFKLSEDTIDATIWPRRREKKVKQ